MADKVRLNKVIDLLAQGKIVFSGGLLYNGNLDLFVKTPRQPGARWG